MLALYAGQAADSPGGSQLFRLASAAMDSDLCRLVAAAAAIRNEVAMQAHRGERPRKDWDAVLDAYFEVWGNATQSASLDCGPRRGTNWTGD